MHLGLIFTIFVLISAASGAPKAAPKGYGKITCGNPPTVTEPLKGWLSKKCKAKEVGAPPDPSKLTPQGIQDMVNQLVGESMKCLLTQFGMVSASGVNAAKIQNMVSIFPDNLKPIKKAAIEKCLQQKGKNLGSSAVKYGPLAMCILPLIDMACSSPEEKAKAEAQLKALEGISG